MAGTISDDAGHGLPSASVLVTALTGRFEITDLPSGTYDVTVSYVGFISKTERVDVVADGETKVDVSLSPTDYQLNPVTVTGSMNQERLIEAPSAGSVVLEEEIAARPTSTLIEHVAGLPGVDYVQTGVNGTRVVIRGFNGSFSSRMMALTDNRISNLPDVRISGDEWIPLTDVDIERIEVPEGPVIPGFDAT